MHTERSSQGVGPMVETTAATLNRRPWHEQFFLLHVEPARPWEVLAHARIHLAEQVMTPGDVAAYWDLGTIQDELLEGQ